MQTQLRPLSDVGLRLLVSLLQTLSLNVLHLRLKRTLSFGILNCLPCATKRPCPCGLTSSLRPCNISLPLRSLNLKVRYCLLIRRHELTICRRTCCHAFVQVANIRSPSGVATGLPRDVTAKFFCTQAHAPNVGGGAAKRLSFGS